MNVESRVSAISIMQTHTSPSKRPTKLTVKGGHISKLVNFEEKNLETPQPKKLPSHTADNFDWQIMNVESRVSAISIIIMQTHLSTTHHIKADLI